MLTPLFIASARGNGLVLASLVLDACAGAPKPTTAASPATAPRRKSLDAAVSAAEGARGCDGKKTDLLKKALRDLRAPAI